MKRPAQILRTPDNMICSLGKGCSFRIPEFPRRTMFSRGGFCANLLPARAIYRIFGRGDYLPSCLILFPCTPISFSYPFYMSEVAKSLFESILTPDFWLLNT